MMFERLINHGQQVAGARADDILIRLMAQLKDELPTGIAVEPVSGGLALFGKRLRRRFVTDPRLRRQIR